LERSKDLLLNLLGKKKDPGLPEFFQNPNKLKLSHFEEGG